MNKATNKQMDAWFSWKKKNPYGSFWESPFVNQFSPEQRDWGFTTFVSEFSILINPEINTYRPYEKGSLYRTEEEVVDTWWNDNLINHHLQYPEDAPLLLKNFASYCKRFGLEASSSLFHEYENSATLLCSQGPYRNFAHVVLRDSSACEASFKERGGVFYQYKDRYQNNELRWSSEGCVSRDFPFELSMYGKRGFRTVFPCKQSALEYMMMLVEVAPLNIERDIQMSIEECFYGKDHKFDPNKWESGMWWTLS